MGIAIRLSAIGLAGSLSLSACGMWEETFDLAAPMATNAQPDLLERESYIRLTAEVLAQAVRAGDTQSVQTFVQFAEGEDPDPSATRLIAQSALQQLPADIQPVRDLVRIANGHAQPRSLAQAQGIRFPEDEGMHPGSLTEWWYLNGHLEGAGRERYGYEFTLFKVGPLLHWAHVAVTDQKGDRFHYVRDFVPKKQVTASTNGLDVQYGPQQLRHDGRGSYRLIGTAGPAQFDLRLAPKKQPLLINGDGKIDMPEGRFSWYYSQTRLEAQGRMTLNGHTRTVNGLSWLDHQWGPFFVSGFKERWDWFALQFEDGTEYNLFGFRDRQGKPVERYVNALGPEGRALLSRDFSLERQRWWQSPLTHLFYTTTWRIALPDTGEVFLADATNDNQEVARKLPFRQDPLPQYWEGSMRATKILPNGQKVRGVAYCEHFGFKQPPRP